MSALGSKPYLGRCAHCDYALFATNDQIDLAIGWAEVKPGEQPKRVGSYGVYARCPDNHKVFALKQIKGTYKEDHKCDSRCTNAKGHDCICSCGGMNHGRGHVIEIHKVDPLSSISVLAAAEADRKRGHVVEYEAPATEAQLRFIASLAGQLGLFIPDEPTTRLKASELINRLKADLAARTAIEQPAIASAVARQEATLAPMTDAQGTLITKLMEERTMAEDERGKAESMLAAGLSKSQASRWITRLLELPQSVAVEA